MKKIFEHFTSSPLPAPHSNTHFGILEQRAAELKNYAQVFGLEGACEKYASVDLFMSAMVTSLSGLKDKVKAGSIDPLLADTLSAAADAMQSMGHQGLDPLQQQPAEGSGPSAKAFSGSLLNSMGSPPAVPSDDGFPKQGSTNDPGAGAQAAGVEPVVARRKLSREARACLERWFQENLASPVGFLGALSPLRIASAVRS